MAGMKTFGFLLGKDEIRTEHERGMPKVVKLMDKTRDDRFRLI